MVRGRKDVFHCFEWSMSAASLMQVGVLGCQSIAVILLDEECTHKVPVRVLGCHVHVVRRDMHP